MSPLDLIRSKDGSMSLTKVAASTFHLLLAATAGWLTYKTSAFDVTMWGLYAAVAVGHAGYDKTLANVRALVDKKLARQTPPAQ